MLLSSITNAQTSLTCILDSGIKKATIYQTLLDKDNQEESNEEIAQVFYAKDGRMIKAKKSFHQTQREFVFRNGLRTMIITSRKKMPDFYNADNEDSLMGLAPIFVDTILVKKHDANGRVKKMKRGDGVYLYFDYYNCEKEVETALASNGDTISQAIQLFKNGVLEKYSMVYLQDTFANKSFYDHKFNERGHWVERKYNTYKGVFIESRKLEYYFRREVH